MYFNFALYLNMTLSSADNPFKQFGPRSGLTFCPDLIGAKLFDTLEVMTSWSWTNVLFLPEPFTWLCQQLTSADKCFKKLDPDQAQHFVQIWSGSKLFDTWRLWQVEVEQMYSIFALNLYMTLSSADNPFKQLGPRSGPTFCPDLIRVQTVWRLSGYEKLKLNQCKFCIKPLHDIVICW